VIADQVVGRSYPRAALIGNPSDGYHGKTIAFVFDDFCAEVSLEVSDRFRIIEKQLAFESLKDVDDHIGLYGFYYVLGKGIEINQERAFSISYKSDIPRGLGLGGSSAIITALINALCNWYKIDMDPNDKAWLVLDAERIELGINAGLQDRVVQSYECPVYMDFDKALIDTTGSGSYRKLDVSDMPCCYIAFKRNAAESSGKPHKDLRGRFDQGEEEVLSAMSGFAELTERFVEALEQKDAEVMNQLIDANFDLRASILDISSAQVDMIQAARSVSASAKFTGSGGAIIGFYEKSQLESLETTMKTIGASLIIPNIISS